MGRINRYLVSILFLSLIVIFFQFNKIPIHIAPDEIAFTRLALFLDKAPLTLYTTLETGHSTLYFYIILASFKLLGVNLFALRFPSAIFGVLNGILMYLIFSLIFRDKLLIDSSRLKLPLSFILTFIFIAMRWHINFSRFAFEATLLLFLELVSVLFCLRYLHKKRWQEAVFSGVFAGLAFNSYTPGRIFFLLPLVTLSLSNYRLSQQSIQLPRLNLLRHIALFLIPFIILVLPLVIQLVQRGDYRVYDELIYVDRDLHLVQKIVYPVKNLISNLSMLVLTGDMNGRHNYPGKPALNPILSILFIGGVMFAVFNKNAPYAKFFILYFILSLIPTIFTHPKGNPSMLRTVTMIPAIIFFIGHGIIGLKRLLSVRLKQNLAVLIILLIIAISPLYELRTYFVYQKEVFKYSFEVRKSFEWVKTRNFQLVDDWYKP